MSVFLKGFSTGWFVVNLCWALSTILRNPIAVIVYILKVCLSKVNFLKRFLKG